MKILMILLSLFLVSAAAFAQPFSIGVKGGIPVTDALNAQSGFFPGMPLGNTSTSPGQISYNSNTKRYLLGPTAELHLPLGFSFEVDALYRRLDYQSSFSAVDSLIAARTTANSWQFPLLLKWALPLGPIRPFVDAGPSVEWVSGVRQVRQVTVFPSTVTITTTSNPAELKNQTTVGFTTGGGLEFKMGPVRIAPEVRYTRWNSDIFHSTVRDLLSTNLNQADFLVGFTF
ncbi:MAG TPA: outer membrane beta-barrel protein [Bryobacteraceae bacterium]|nr:outer membrane beta-barrel protein [Bryobacteraceae bacterium]